MTVQDPLAGMVAPVSVTVVAEAAAATVPPVHVVAAVGVSATVRPEGRVSTSTAPVSGMVLGLVRVMVSVEDAPGVTVAGLKDLAMVAVLLT